MGSEAVPHDWGTCIHEAGHPVAYLATGVPVIKLWVDGTDGRCHHGNPGNAIGCLAGTAAEWRVDYPGRVPTAHTLLNYLWSGDLQAAVEHLGTPDGALLVATWVAARRLVDDDWASVVRIAQALQQRGRLTGDEATALWRA